MKNITNRWFGVALVGVALAVTACGGSSPQNMNGTFIVTPSVDSHTTVSPTAPQTVIAGATQTFVVSAAAGYVLNATAAGTCPAGSFTGTSYTTGSIIANCTVLFSSTGSAATFAVTPSGMNVTISPSGVQTVSVGATTAFIVTPTIGYVLASAASGTCAAGSFNGNVYTTGAITADCTVTFSASQPAPWANSVTTGAAASIADTIAIDGTGNVYMAGAITGTGAYGFGNSVTATGSYNGANMVVVKYNTAGVAQWAKTAAGATFTSTINAIAVDASGNVYVAGALGNGTSTYDLGNNVSVSGAYANGNNAFVAKYDTTGVAQWAKSVSTAAFTSVYSGIALDGSANVYAVGTLGNNSSFGFGNSVTATGSYNGNNLLVAKYNASGTAQWAQTTTSGAFTSAYTSVAVDSAGNVYAAGKLGNNDSYSIGNGVNVAGAYANGDNALLAKYSNAGVAQWASSTTTAAFTSDFNAVAVDGNGDVYVAGAVSGSSAVTFGTNATATGGFSNGNNALLVKFSNSGVAELASTVTTAAAVSIFNGVAVDPLGDVYAVGEIDASAAYGFGNNITATGTYPSGSNFVVVRYSGGTGLAQTAMTTTGTVATSSVFDAVAVDANGTAYAAGAISGTTSFTFGSGATAGGAFSNGTNAVVVKF